MKELTPSTAVRIAAEIYNLKEISEGQDGVDDLSSHSPGGVRGYLEAADRAGTQNQGFLPERFGFTPVKSFHASTGFGKGASTPFGSIAEGIDYASSNRFGEGLIAIRGTISGSLNDWITDVRALPKRVGDQYVHRGFHHTFSTFEKHIDTYLDKKAPKVVHCVGHSMGGAVATLVAKKIRSRDSGSSCQIKLYTFGAPRVGFSEFNRTLEEQIGRENIYRVYHDADVVSMVPYYRYLQPSSGFHDDGYYLDWAGGTVSAFAHMIGNYVSTIGDAEWGNLKGNAAKWSARSGWEADLISPITSFNMHSASLFWMIRRALSYILKKVGGLGAAGQLPSHVTSLDTLAWVLHTGAAASICISEMIEELIAHIMQFLGRKVEQGIKMTVAFIRWVLDTLCSTLQIVASRSLAML